jgi:DNA-binding transcriptional ArsR family regulator
MADEELTPAESLEVHGLETLKLMADSLRLQLLDYLRRDSGTVREMAAELGVSPKSLYYHVNLLEKHGLIRVVSTRLVSGIQEKRYRATAYLFNFTGLGGGSRDDLAQRGLQAVSSLFSITKDEIRVALESGAITAADEAPPNASLNLEWGLLNLPYDVLTELKAHIKAVVEGYLSDQPPSPGEQTYRLLFTIFPSYRRGERPETIPPSTTRGGEE